MFKKYGILTKAGVLILYPSVTKVGDGRWLINFLFWYRLVKAA